MIPHSEWMFFTVISKVHPTDSVLCSRAEIALTDGRLMGVAQELNVTAEEEKALSNTLSVLEGELRDLNSTVALKQKLLEDLFTSGFAGG